MSRENVELVRSGIETLRDEGWPALLPLLDSEFEFTTPADLAMEPDTYRGEEGLRRYFESFEDAMEDIRIVPERELLDAGDKVFVPFKLSARGKETASRPSSTRSRCGRFATGRRCGWRSSARAWTP